MFSEELLKKAEAGNLKAALKVANGYYYGNGVEQDDDKAFSWYLRVLEIDPWCGQALCNLGTCYRFGYGTYPNAKKAVKLYTKAVSADYADAFSRLADCMSKGEGCKKNDKMAFVFYKKGAELGDVESQRELGRCYLNGIGCVKDEKKAAQWFAAAMEQNDLFSKLTLANMYATGSGVTADYKKAETYYKDVLARSEGNIFNYTIMNLALLYYNKTSNYSEAIEIWRKMASKGVPNAKFNLGQAYFHGKGVAKDNQMALYWWKQAAVEGHEDAAKNIKFMKNKINDTK